MPDQTISPPGVTPFDLDGLADLARKVSPEIASQVDLVSPQPEVDPQTEPAPELEVETEVATPTETAAQPEVENSDQDTTLASELEELNRQSIEAKTKPVTKNTEPLKEVKTPGVAQRDEDLSLDVRQSASMHPRTKKIIEERNQKIIAERNKADAIAKEKEALAAELNLARADLKKGVVPKDVADELTKLRERVRELDITQDPSLETKYDKPATENQTKILEILKEFGVGETKDGKNDPETIEELKRSGLNFKTVTPFIKKLSDSGYEEEAEQLRELLRDNIRIKNSKDKEISEWRSNFEIKKQQATQFSQQQQEKSSVEIREHASRILTSDIAELSKDFPFLNRPPESVATDSPAVARAKQDALTAYDDAAKAIALSVADLDSSKVSPDKFAEVNGRITSNAVQNIIIKQHVLPRLIKDLAELKARNADLESKVGKFKTAGTLSRAHAAAAVSPAGVKAALPENTEDAARQIAREMGISIG